MAEHGNITIKRARVHNLKDIDVVIPRNKLIVITGFRAPVNRRWLLTRFMPRGNGVMWRAFRLTPASFSDE